MPSAECRHEREEAHGHATGRPSSPGGGVPACGHAGCVRSRPPEAPTKGRRRAATRAPGLARHHPEGRMTRTRKLLLASAAIAVICSLQAVTPDLAHAAEVLRGGALDVVLSGFGLFRAHGGQLDNQYGDRTLTTGVDFSNDYELHVLVSGRYDAAGLEYGAHLEFGGNTDRTAQTDEEWLWLRGGFGEFRFG